MKMCLVSHFMLSFNHIISISLKYHTLSPSVMKSLFIWLWLMVRLRCGSWMWAVVTQWCSLCLFQQVWPTLPPFHTCPGSLLHHRSWACCSLDVFCLRSVGIYCILRDSSSSPSFHNCFLVVLTTQVTRAVCQTRIMGSPGCTKSSMAAFTVRLGHNPL